MKKSTKKITLFVTLGLFVLTGTYNALVINADSTMKDVRFAKRLDEVYGVVKEGRQIAGFSSWQKLEAPTKMEKIVIASKAVETKASNAASAETFSEPTPEASMQEQLSLNLVEVSHPTKWQQGLKEDQFRGSLSTNNGVIEELNVSLPGTPALSASFSEMTGNVFEYEMSGEIYSGLMYQVNQNAYMVTLTSGPLEGTRLRFSTSSPEEEQMKTQEVLAENNIESGSFGTTQAPEQMIQNEQAPMETALESQSFNLGAAQSL